MEVDIFEDGSLDMSDELLGRLDSWSAASTPSSASTAEAMTRRMVMAIANPHVDILGHCTNRKVVGPRAARRPSSTPRSCSPPAPGSTPRSRSTAGPSGWTLPTSCCALAVEWDCKVAIDTDAHAPGQLEWQPYGCDKAAACDVPIESVVNSWGADELTAWAAGHDAR